MSETAKPSARRGWALHAKLVGVGAVLIVPVLALDLACLGPSSGGFFQLDFRGLLVGAYVALYVVHSLLATGFVALGAGRSKGVALAAHGASICALVAAAAIWSLVSAAQSDAYYEEAERERAEAIERAPGELALVEWSFDADPSSPQVELTLEATTAGRVELESAFVSGLSGRFYEYRGRDVAAGERVSFRAGHSDSGDEPTRDLVEVRWTSATSESEVSMAFCHPDCPVEGETSVDGIYTDVRRPMPEPMRRPAPVGCGEGSPIVACEALLDSSVRHDASLIVPQEALRSERWALELCPGVVQALEFQADPPRDVERLCEGRETCQLRVCGAVDPEQSAHPSGLPPFTIYAIELHE